MTPDGVRLRAVLGSSTPPGRLHRALAQALDRSREAPEGKVVALASMGGSDHHFLGADRHLRDVLGFFGALVTPVSVYLTAADFDDGEPGERAASALDELIAGAVSLATVTHAHMPLGPSPLAARMIRR
jgi:FMN reductase